MASNAELQHRYLEEHREVERLQELLVDRNIRLIEARARIAKLEKSRDYWKEAAEEWAKWLSVSAEKIARLKTAGDCLSDVADLARVDGVDDELHDSLASACLAWQEAKDA